MQGSELTFTVSEFVAVLNQTLEYAYPAMTISGELANFRISKNRWVYFDLKDEEATVRFFGTVYQLPGPLEDGMMLQVRGVPRLHPQYGFSVTIQKIQPTGEGSIKKAATLLQAKLAAEGLFDAERKRPLPYPPRTVGLITSAESAAYRDFIKVLGARWGGVSISLLDIQVQGELCAPQIVRAVRQFNGLADPPEVLVITRGGGSAEDLQAFSTEPVTRAIAASRIPTIVAIGHEIDISLAELAADKRASTPSNAAELLVPDRKDLLRELRAQRTRLAQTAGGVLGHARTHWQRQQHALSDAAQQAVQHAAHQLALHARVLEAYDPQAVLRRGYALVYKEGSMVRSGTQLTAGDTATVRLQDATATVRVQHIQPQGGA